MKLRLSQPSDEFKIKSFSSQFNLPGSIDLNIERVGQFQNHYQIQSDDYLTYLLVNNKDEIEAMASLIFREAIIDGEKETICFATDLKVSNSRAAVLKWSDFFIPALEMEKSKRHCKFVFSVFAGSQKQAINAFIRPRPMKRQLPRYFLFRDLNIVSLHGLWPLHIKPLTTINIDPIDPSRDIDKLLDYLVKKKSNSPINFSWNKDILNKSISRWFNQNWSNFLLATDKNKNIIGCSTAWSSKNTQTIKFGEMTPQALTLKESLFLLSLFGMAKKLPSKNQLVDFCYLTHLHADNPDIFYTLLFQNYKNSSKNEFLVYTHFDDHWLTRPPKSFISTSIPGSLYSLLSPEQSIPNFLKPTTLKEPPDFEISWW